MSLVEDLMLEMQSLKDINGDMKKQMDEVSPQWNTNETFSYDSASKKQNQCSSSCLNDNVCFSFKDRPLEFIKGGGRI